MTYGIEYGTRTLLASAASGIFLGGSGCLSGDDNDEDCSGGGCPEPRGIDLDPDDELSYEEHESEQFSESLYGVTMIADPDDIDSLDEGVMTDAEREWIEGTDFIEDVVIGLQVSSASDSSELTIHGVEREQRIVQGEGMEDETVHVYSCMACPGEADDVATFSRLLRVSHGGERPDSAGVTHWDGSHRRFG